MHNANCIAIASLLLLSLLGCRKDTSSDTAALQPDPGTKSNSDRGTRSMGGKPAEAAGHTSSGRSSVPTLAEWNAQTREVTVTGSSALGCETKMVREWLRVSCRGTNAVRGRPTGVTVLSGNTGKGEFFTFAKGDVASLVFPFVEGTNVTAKFDFTQGAHVLTSQWPMGAPMPQAMGRF